MEIANSLLVDKTSVIDIIKADYNYVIDKFTYSEEKVANEDSNIRIGALAAINGGPTVCMEYADTLITLLRAQGIPARSVIGYDTENTYYNKLFQEQVDKYHRPISHQWVQAYIPDYGWLSIDPTWGDSDGKWTSREYIGPDLDHVLWLTDNSQLQEPTLTHLFSADQFTNDYNYKLPELEITAVTKEEVGDLSQLKTSTQLLNEFNTTKKNAEDFDFQAKTSMWGRALYYFLYFCTAPLGCLLIVWFVVVIVVVRKIRKANRTNIIPFSRP